MSTLKQTAAKWGRTAPQDASFQVVVLGVDYLGSSLPMDYTNADGTANYDKTSLRMGYKITFPEGYDASKCSWAWDYGTDLGLGYTRNGVNYETVEGEENAIIANLVFTNIGRSNFDDVLFAKLRVGLDFDGATYEYTDEVRSQSVYGVAELIADAGSASDLEKNYAQGILATKQATEGLWTQYV